MEYKSGIETSVPRRRFQLLPDHSYVGWTPYAWLLWLSIFLVEPIARTRFGPVPIWLWPATILGLCIFLPSYFLGYWPPTRRLPYIAALQTLLGLVFAPINTGASVFFVYAGSFAAQIPDARRALRWLLAIAALGGIAAFFTQVPVYFAISSVGVTLLIGGVNLHFTQVGRTQRKLVLAQQEVEHLAAVAERERIARDLHDVLGHTLSLIILKSELASKLADRDPQRAAREIRDVESVSRKALQEVRDAIRGYRATLNDEIERARSLLKAGDIEADIEIEPLELTAAQTETLALSLREAITNVVRHASAQRCMVRVRATGNHVVLDVSDDGRGIVAPEGGGLRGMRERVEALGGTVDRSHTNGSRLTVSLPLEVAAEGTRPRDEGAA